MGWRVSTVTNSETEGQWSLSLLYIGVMVILSLSGIFSFGVASFAWASDGASAMARKKRRSSGPSIKAPINAEGRRR